MSSQRQGQIEDAEMFQKPREEVTRRKVLVVLSVPEGQRREDEDGEKDIGDP